MTAASSVAQAVIHPACAEQQLQQTASGISFRGLQARDFDQIKAAHADLFPIDYEDSFFIRATQGLDRIWSCAAVVSDAYGNEQLVGFITAKTALLHEVDPSDRQHMGLLSAVLDHDRVLYIMTLGVLQGHRHRGLASTLIAITCQHAYETRCRAVFLHVITYNSAAMSLYVRQGFSCVAKLRQFYYIATGRTPDPHQQVYDAYLFVQYVGGSAGMPSPWDLVSLAWSPLRLAFNRIHACMPGFCRAEQEHHQQQEQQQHQEQQQGLLAGHPGAAAWGGQAISSIHQQPGSSYRQQQEQQQHHQQPLQQQMQMLHQQRQQQMQHQQQQMPHLAQQLWHSQPVQPQPSGSRQRHRPGDLQEQQAWQYGMYQQPALIHQGMQPPQQRMLRWLFNGASRSGLPVELQQQHTEQHMQ